MGELKKPKSLFEINRPSDGFDKCKFCGFTSKVKETVISEYDCLLPEKCRKLFKARNQVCNIGDIAL